MAETLIKLAALSDVGLVREINEDNFIVNPDISANKWSQDQDSKTDILKLNNSGALLVVADGMGGQNAGEIASAIAIEGIKVFFNKNSANLPSTETDIRKFLAKAILFSHDKIVEDAKANAEHKGMGTTLVLAWIICDKVYVSWSGDSRAYIYCNTNDKAILQRLSTDHSMVQDLVTKGQITEEQAFFHPDSNIITQCLGDSSHKPNPDFISFYIGKGDRILLCTDGLCGLIQDQTIEEIFRNEVDINLCCKSLIESAKNAGGHDNITVIICDITSTSSNQIKKNENYIFTSESTAKKNKKRFYIFLALFLILLGNAIIFNKEIKHLFKPGSSDTSKIASDSSTVDNKNPLKIANSMDSIPATKDTSTQALDNILKKIISKLKKIDSLGDKVVSDSIQQLTKKSFSIQLNMLKTNARIKGNSRHIEIKNTLNKLLSYQYSFPSDSKGLIKKLFAEVDSLENTY